MVGFGFSAEVRGQAVHDPAKRGFVPKNVEENRHSKENH